MTIRSGYSANAEIVLAHAEKVLTIPESCIEFSGDSTFVYVENGNQKFERKEVKTGLSDGIYIEIKSGLKANEVIRGKQKEE